MSRNDSDIKVPETGEFSAASGWMIMSRAWDEAVGEATEIVEVLPIKGVGVMLRTWGRHSGYDEPVLVPNVMVLEHIKREPSSVLDANGAPSSVTTTLMGRELMAADFITAFVPNAQNPIPGFVLALSDGPAPAKKPTGNDTVDMPRK